MTEEEIKTAMSIILSKNILGKK
ncbi:hypothetical protein PN290_06570 [Romboutsia sp. 1001216sp1]|nr:MULTISPECIES: hypothetical protein [unclassified Romboutsia]MDB8789692.1 hypothetical protein [Romboutsia sp. 1001216sp1]MDB8795229.1 hypothetical protein [Romboutsia sp. 1001216sp1]MDB8799038.1 hypothetical protein [Romboutsia sp. 1001216sp1]MDB8801840.1 hypothetical protein [Romboutsia sp. 1001216sp1]MDB8813237.1 hypothetical protein [Romboutsia sp. 1001216sp1]